MCIPFGLEIMGLKASSFILASFKLVLSPRRGKRKKIKTKNISELARDLISCVLFRYGHMIDNVVLIVTGTLHERDVQELLEKCHPLGMFDR